VISTGENRDVVTAAMNHWSIEAVPCSGVVEAARSSSPASPPHSFSARRILMALFAELLERYQQTAKTRVVVISRDAELDAHYNEALALGAFDMIASPCRRSDVQWIAIRAMQDELRRSGGRRRTKLGPHEIGSTPPPENGEGTIPNGQ
jgi:DNA-binding NtrC family response regulator